MAKFEKILTKKEENALSADDKKIYRAWKKEYLSQNPTKEAEDSQIKLKDKISDSILEMLKKSSSTKEDYLALFKEHDLSSKTWGDLLSRIYANIYSFRKRFGVIGRDVCNEQHGEYIQKEGAPFFHLIAAIYEFFPYKKFEEIQSILIEGLKFQVEDIRLLSVTYLKNQIENDNIRISFWQELLQKRYVSGSTWKVLIEYYPKAIKKGIQADLYNAIHAFMNNSDKYHVDVLQTEKKWEELKINPLETYKS
ncbi:MAG: hypothetical protein ACK5N8_07955 [Alphaproteobacteria bacterium]